MGRPINRQRYLETTAPHQIQATVWGTNDTQATAGYLSGQNSPRRFRATTVNGTSLTKFVNGSGNLVQGTSYVNVFPVGTQPTTYATGSATLKAVGNANVTFGGANYHANDYVLFIGGTYAHQANVQVLTVNATGSILTLSAPVNGGSGVQAYSALPGNISAINTSNSTGNGYGAILSSNFGVDTATVLTGGAGYTSAVFVVEGETVEPTFTQPTVSGGAVTTGAVTVLTPGVVNVNPVVDIEEETGATEILSYLSSQYYLETFQGNHYRWLYKGQAIPTDYASLGIKLAYLDTL